MTDQKTVKVRILVGVDSKGAWNAAGWRSKGKPAAPFHTLQETLSDFFDAVTFVQYSWIEVELPIPAEDDAPTHEGLIIKTNLTPEDN